MRFRIIAVVLISALSASPIPVTGQEDPLPVVRAKSQASIVLPEEPTVYLDVEPVRSEPQVTLAEAARTHDYVSFAALYGNASGNDRATYATLHELWQYSVTNPVGAWYGREMYERYARAYPGFADYIADYAIVDSNGNTFYPTQETRTFLLRRIDEGRSTPRVLIADTAPAPRRAVASTTTTTTRATSTPRRRLQKAEVTAPPVVAPIPTPAPVVVASATPAPVQQAPVQAPVAQTPAPIQAAVVTPQAIPSPQQQSNSRGLFLLIIGLVGIGILALLLRAPREEQPTSIIHPVTEAPKDKVEPIRKTG